MKKQLSISTLANAAKREITMRNRVYPGRVQSGKMTQETADHEIEAMKQIHTLLLDLEIQDRGSLFADKQTGKGIIEEYALRLPPAYQAELSEKLGIDEMNVRLVYLDGALDAMLNLRTISQTTPNETLKLSPAARIKHLPACAQKQKHYLYVPLQTLRVNQKIAVFCEAYKARFGEQYKVHGRESKRWNTTDAAIPAKREELDFYMSCAEYPIDTPKTITDFLGKYQQIKQLMVKNVPDAFPDTYDRALMQKLAKDDVGRYQEYRKHLVALGYMRLNKGGGEMWTKIGGE